MMSRDERNNQAGHKRTAISCKTLQSKASKLGSRDEYEAYTALAIVVVTARDRFVVATYLCSGPP